MEFGGYFSLEIDCNKDIVFDAYSCLKLNSGRAAICVAAIESRAKRLLIPYYNCKVVSEMLDRHGINYSYYYLDENMEPSVESLDSDEFILIVNYFGNKSLSDLYRMKRKYSNIIFDNTQAFYSEPVEHCYNVYSCRKFFGVSDGAFLVREKGYEFDYPLNVNRDVSWERAGYLLKSCELGTNEGYRSSLESEESIGYDIKSMSILTEKLMRSIDCDAAKESRLSNLKFLKNNLDCYNELCVDINIEPLMAYPLLIKDMRFRQYLVNNKIYTPQWWKYLKEIIKSDSYESCLCDYLTMIPLDQRYNVNDMHYMVEKILLFFENKI